LREVWHERPAMVTTVTVFRGVAAGAVPIGFGQDEARLVPAALLWRQCVEEDAAARWGRLPMAAAPGPVSRAAALRWWWRRNRFRTAEQRALPPDARERPWLRSPALPARAPRQGEVVVVVVVPLRPFPALPLPWLLRRLPARRWFRRGGASAPVPQRVHQSNWSASSFR
jgi:hypothetical protein